MIIKNVLGSGMNTRKHLIEFLFLWLFELINLMSTMVLWKSERHCFNLYIYQKNSQS
jgi:hypothetical protein